MVLFVSITVCKKKKIVKGLNMIILKINTVYGLFGLYKRMVLKCTSLQISYMTPEDLVLLRLNAKSLRWHLRIVSYSD